MNSSSDIIRYMSVDKPITSSGVGFIFGTRYPEIQDLFAVRAGELYRSKKLTHIIISGGPQKDNPEIIESHAIKRKIIEQEVPEEIILTEEKSTNTKENVDFSLNLLEREVGFSKISCIISICKDYHARRSLMTLQAALNKLKCDTKNVCLFSSSVLEAGKNNSGKFQEEYENPSAFKKILFEFKKSSWCLCVVGRECGVWIKIDLNKCCIIYIMENEYIKYSNYKQNIYSAFTHII